MAAQPALAQPLGPGGTKPPAVTAHTAAGGGYDSVSSLGSAGDGLGGGICAADGAVGVTNSLVYGNMAVGGYGTVGGDGMGGGIYAGATTLTVNNSTLEVNEAAGGHRDGNGLGGGIYVASGAVTLSHSTVTGNYASAVQGAGGQGIGGGLYIAGGSVCLDKQTLAAIGGNYAETSNPDIFGSFTIC